LEPELGTGWPAAVTEQELKKEKGSRPLSRKIRETVKDDCPPRQGDRKVDFRLLKQRGQRGKTQGKKPKLAHGAVIN